MAKQRGYLKGRSNTLGLIAQVTLGVTLDKDPAVRTSHWSTGTLTEIQKEYAALDVIVPLRIYCFLLGKPDLTKRLTSSEAKDGVKVDIVPSHGSLVTMASRAATGIIIPSVPWNPPAGFTMKNSRRLGSLSLVRIEVVHAEKYVVPGYRHGTSKVTLADFGTPPFDLILSLTVLAPHHAMPTSVDNSTSTGNMAIGSDESNDPGRVPSSLAAATPPTDDVDHGELSMSFPWLISVVCC